ncbi:hypothetical protein TcCL_NonESM10562 [Trypanosoma cruzi]|nr:hypothetical protein TcCL_NonESM10562 [Trypanosoma cruzi]
MLYLRNGEKWTCLHCGNSGTAHYCGTAAHVLLFFRNPLTSIIKAAALWGNSSTELAMVIQRCHSFSRFHAEEEGNNLIMAAYFILFFFALPLWCEFWSQCYLPVEGCSIFTSARDKKNMVLCAGASSVSLPPCRLPQPMAVCILLRGSCGCAVLVEGRARSSLFLLLMLL